MADEQPTNWELARRLDDLRSMLRGEVVTVSEYSAQKRADDRRMDDFDRRLDDAKRSGFEAIARERAERMAADEAINTRITTQAEAGAEHRDRWRTLLWTLFWTGLVPAVIALIGILVTLHLTGGH